MADMTLKLVDLLKKTRGIYSFDMWGNRTTLQQKEVSNLSIFPLMGRTLTDKLEIMERWRQYCENLWAKEEESDSSNTLELQLEPRVADIQRKWIAGHLALILFD